VRRATDTQPLVYKRLPLAPTIQFKQDDGSESIV